MKITNVYIKLVESKSKQDKLLAFAEAEFDNCFIVHELRVMNGSRGEFVSMPDRKILAHCPACGHKNKLLAKYCNECGKSVMMVREDVLVGDPCPECNGIPSDNGTDDDPYCDICGDTGYIRARIYVDVAHPITDAFRLELQAEVLKAYHKKLSQSRLEEWKVGSR